MDSGKHVEYDVQEIAVEMNREEETEEDWLKMDHPPEWLRRVEVEEYDDWLPPPVRPQPPPEVRTQGATVGGIPTVVGIVTTCFAAVAASELVCYLMC